MRFLVVDDSRTTRTIIRGAIHEGLPDSEILEAADGQEALDLLRNEKLEIDVVMADWDMPRLDGITFLKKLRALSPFRDIPVLMITSRSDRASVVEALKSGAKDFILKPFSAEVLASKLRTLREQIEVKKNEETTVMLRMIADAAPREDDLPFLARLPDEIAAAVRECALPARHAAGSFILRAGQEVDALLVVLEGEVDVSQGGTVLDILEPGECVGERAFMSGTPFPLEARARLDVAIGAVPRGRLGDLVRRFPKLRFHLGALLSPRDSAGSLSGGTDAVALGDLVQVLHITRKSGVLEIRRGAAAAGIAFDGGEVRHAWTDAATGEEAFRAILAWRGAAFEFRSGASVREVTIRRPVLTLLLEHPK